MMDLFIMLAGMAPMEVAVEQVEETIAAFKVNPNAKNEHKMAVACQFLVVKVKLGKDGKDPFEEGMKLIEVMKKMEQREKLFDIKDQKS